MSHNTDGLYRYYGSGNLDVFCLLVILQLEVLFSTLQLRKVGYGHDLEMEI
jgi:hypothetical protein